MKKTAGLIPVGLMLLLSFSAMLIPLKVQAQEGIPTDKIELKISNTMNETRTDEPVIMRIINLTQAGLPEDYNPDSLRITDVTDTEIPCQYDDLTDYGYDKYIVFPATVPGKTNATYYLHYATGSWEKPNYAAAVPMTDMGTNYTFTANTYSAVVIKANGVMVNIKTNNSGILLNNFGGSSYGATGWEFGWYQSGINDSTTTLVAQGAVRTVIAVEGKIWYTDKTPYPGSSNWAFTTIYFIYKDRVEAMTHQVYEGTSAMQLMQARVGISHSVIWMLDSPATLDTPPTPFTETIQNPYSGYASEWSEYSGCVWTIYPIRDNYPENGKWADITSANGTFGYGTIFYDSANIIRIELGDGRSWGAGAQNVTELNFIQFNMWPGGPVPPGLELWYHWTLIPHENKDYTYTQMEAKKAYNPLGFYVERIEKKVIKVPLWVVYVAFFGAAAAIVVLFARKLRS